MFLWSLSLLNVNIKLDSPWTHLQAMSHSLQYKQPPAAECDSSNAYLVSTMSCAKTWPWLLPPPPHPLRKKAKLCLRNPLSHFSQGVCIWTPQPQKLRCVYRTPLQSLESHIAWRNAGSFSCYLMQIAGVTMVFQEMLNQVTVTCHDIIVEYHGPARWSRCVSPERRHSPGWWRTVLYWWQQTGVEHDGCRGRPHVLPVSRAG